MLCVKFGQKIPFESATEILAVGNAANAAVSASRIGLISALVTNIGDDKNGEDCLRTLKEQGVATEFVRAHKGMRTNYHYVLQYDAERTILVKHEKYERIMPVFETPPKWFYLTSLGGETADFQIAIAKYAKNNNVRLAFQPGTFQIKMGKEVLAAVYRATEVLFCNKEESQQILQTQESDIKKLLAGLRELGPAIVVITYGVNGAYFMDNSGVYIAPMYPDPSPPVNRTGAGDATSSGMIAFIGLGLSTKDALLRGMIDSASVVQHVGAQAGLLTREKIEEWYAKRPADFEVRKI